MKKVIISLAFLLFLVIAVKALLVPEEKKASKLMLLKEKYSQKPKKKVDHTRFDVLKKKFNSPQEATLACISCHTERAKEVMNSNHWQWERPEYIAGRGIVYLGKKNAINNFCIGVEGSEKSCAKCHIGYGMSSEKTFNFGDSANVDCLVCHDNSETYIKAPEQGGKPAENIDLSNIAQHVGKPKRSNCGVCHFFGGGGNNVKHGDLEKAMFDPARSVDIHMSPANSNLQCVDCHTTKNHMISGKMFSLSSMNRDRVFCEDCHTANPHDNDILNNHTVKVSCQTCHIPVYAKVNATKTSWDWSTAGKLKNGEPFETDDKDGNHTYLSIKGTFTWGKNLTPDYIWCGCTANHYLLGDKIQDTSKTLVLNPLQGYYGLRNSRIIPVKIHTANQPFDPVTRLLIQPKLYAENKGEGGYWKDFDWYAASAAGMKEVGLPFSGKISFIKTAMYWPINHMVSPKEKSVQCEECHNSNNSRLAKVTGFYMPARDHNELIEAGGMAVVLLSLFGVFAHGFGRVYSSIKNKKEVIP